jgi:hypothetical protein
VDCKKIQAFRTAILEREIQTNFKIFLNKTTQRINNIPTAGSAVPTAAVIKSHIFWDITPCSRFKVNRRFDGTCLHLQGRRSQARNQHEAGSKRCCFMLVSCLDYSATLTMQVTYSSGTLVDIQQSTRRYIPEDRTLQYSSS